MTTVVRYTLIVLCLTVSLVCSRCAAQPAVAQASKYPDPTRFEKGIQAFESQDARKAPPTGAVLCIGSSTMRMWHEKIDEDLAPLTIVARGFGGSTMFDLLHFSDRIVLPYQPRAIVIYEGDNDVAKGVGAEEIRDTFQSFVKKVHGKLPRTRIYFLAVKPSHSRREMWSTMKETNKLIADECARDKRLHYVDIAAPLLGTDGTVRRELFKEDELHLNRAGYELLRDALRPILIKQELPLEKKEPRS